MFTILGADGKEYGPVPAAKIHEWINGGRANRQTKARRSDETEWKALGDFPEFAAQPSSAAEPAPISVPAAEVIPTMAPGGVQDSVAAGIPVLAGRWERLGAQLIDGLIGCGVALPGFGLMLAAGVLSNPEQPNVPLMLAGVCVFGVALLVLLVIQVYLLTTRGQTLGKKFLGIKIVTHPDGANAGFVKAFLLRVFVNGLIGAVPVVGPVYSLVDVCFIFRADQRCIHDLIAGTVVVAA